MSVLTTLSNQAEEAYEALAPAYDLLTGSYEYDRWLTALERLALAHGLIGRRLLDVACGTGESFLPMLKRGYHVTGCDISGRMLDQAADKAPDVALYQADMRELPTLGKFDLITCLDDALNYLLEPEELEAALRGIAENLAPGGIALWDLNTLAQYQGQFAGDHIVVDEDTFIGWRRTGPRTTVRSGDAVEIAIDVFTHCGDDCWQRSSSCHRQRHWPRSTVEQLCRCAGVELLEVRGQQPGAVIRETLEESVHTKAIYVARGYRREG